jgi:hypothetical protein
MRFCPAKLLLATLCALGTFGFAQKANDPAAASALSGAHPSYIRQSPVSIVSGAPGQFTISSSTVIDATTGKTVDSSNNLPPNPNANANHSGGSTIDGLDTLPTFDGAFVAGAGPSDGSLFRFSMIGNHPLAGGNTKIPAKISEVSLQLLNADGSVFTTVPFAPFEMLTLDSPNFERTNYRSGTQIQFADAIQRAEFYKRMGPNWHTTLVPEVVKCAVHRKCATRQRHRRRGA